MSMQREMDSILWWWRIGIPLTLLPSLKNGSVPACAHIELLIIILLKGGITIGKTYRGFKPALQAAYPELKFYYWIGGRPSPSRNNELELIIISHPMQIP